MNKINWFTPKIDNINKSLLKTTLSSNFISEGKITQKTQKRNKIIHKLTKSFKRNDLFINSMKHFVDRVYKKKQIPLCDLKEGVKSLIAINSINKKLIN